MNCSLLTSVSPRLLTLGKRTLLLTGLLLLLGIQPAIAQDAVAPPDGAQNGAEPAMPEMDAQTAALMARYNAIQWQEGPATVQIGSLAEIKLPAGMRFASSTHAQTLLELYDNPHNSNILGAIVPNGEDESWTLIFQFDDIGYVKDDDKDALDANAILSGFQSSLPEMNRQRKEIGSSECSAITWAEKPFYDTETNNLTWALNLAFPDGNSINYDIRMLGRKGVMEATILGDAATYTQAVPKVKQLLTGYSFTSGNKYAEWAQGDKVAGYGLAALVAGGGLALGAKTGLLAKLGLLLAKGGKAIILGLVVVGGAIVSFFKKMFGGGRGETYSE